ncbi:MAG: 16S rRNA (cytosine(1402)-N(4))-methyltransferase RsmH [Sphaerochaetaceae bacterium]
MEYVHYSVLQKPVLELLTVDPEKETKMVDCTLGEGGHSLLFLKKYPKLHVTGLDRDSQIIKKAEERLVDFKDRFEVRNIWFNDFFQDQEENSLDLVLFDLGISIFHYVEANRGFSFQVDEKLDMRLNKDSDLTAAKIVNTYKKEDLADLIYKYGEERYSRQIASAIEESRKIKQIETTKELENIIFHAVPYRYKHGHIHPATRTFQAIRIEVNHELDRIEPALEGAIRALKVGGKLGVITFHSLEDRQVKWLFKKHKEEEEPDLVWINKKPIIANEEECKINPPSRSAKLRVVEKVEKEKYNGKKSYKKGF